MSIKKHLLHVRNNNNNHPIFRFLLMACITSLCVAALSQSSTLAKAPPVTCSVYDEAYPMLLLSKLVYGFGDLVNAAREGKIDLKGPDGNPMDLTDLASIDFRSPEYNNGDGWSFADILDLLDTNRDVLEANFDPSFNRKIIAGLKEYYASPSRKGEANEIFLATYRNLQGKKACVYGVIKDRRNKKIIVVFRGSMTSGRDWRTNLNYLLKSMETPEKIQDKMKGRLQNRVLVHKGFYNYLFENDKMKNDYQRFDNIIDDIKPLMIEEEGYSLYITGHSLGGALAHLFTFELAGAGEKYDWVPRPLTCITFGAPLPGTGGYRAAYEQLEKDDLIRCLRVVNVEDPVPALSPIAIPLFLGFPFSPMKHTGINLRLSKNGIRLEHSSKAGFLTKIRNSLFKPYWMFLFSLLFNNYEHPHSLEFYSDRMMKNNEALHAIKLDDLYKDENVVSAKFLAGFLAGEVSEYSSEEL